MSWQLTFSLIYYIGRFESIFSKDTVIWRLKKFLHQKIIRKGASFGFLFIQQTFEDFCADFCETFQWFLLMIQNVDLIRGLYIILEMTIFHVKSTNKKHFINWKSAYILKY